MTGCNVCHYDGWADVILAHGMDDAKQETTRPERQGKTKSWVKAGNNTPKRRRAEKLQFFFAHSFTAHPAGTAVREEVPLRFALGLGQTLKSELQAAARPQTEGGFKQERGTKKPLVDE